MENKVDYGKNKVDFSQIMWNLHNVAMSNAKNDAIRLYNTAFSDDGNKFNGAGEYALFLSAADGKTVEDSQKQEYLEFAKTYVKYFVGEDASKLVKKEDLQPLVDFRNLSVETGEASDTRPTSESLYISRSDRILEESLGLFFEAEGDSETSAPTSSDVSSDVSATSSGDEGEDESNEGQQKGFCIYYAIDVAGSQKRTFANVMKRKTLGLFGGMLADLRNMEIKTLGGGSLKLGKLFDPAKWKDALGTPDINIATVDNNIQNIVHNDYPQSSVIARVYDRDSLINLLRERRKGGKEVEDKIRKAQYSVTIQVEKRDGAYSEFTKEKIADICTRAFGTSTNLMNRNKVTADDVILIPDWTSEYRTQSTYDLKRNSSTNPMSSTGAVTKESGEMFILKGDIVESILMDMFGEDVIEESAEDIVTEDEFRRMFERVLTESDFQDLKDIRKEMKRIGFKTLHGGLDRLKEYYKEELQKFRDELSRGELPKCKPFTNFDEDSKNRFIKNKDQLIKYLFNRRYMEPSDDNPLLRFILGGRGNDRLNWRNQDSLEQYIEHVNRYFGKDIDERGISGNNFGYPVEAMVFLRALRRMQPEDEGDGRISVLFTKKNPSDASSPVESISSFVGDKGSFKGSDYPDSDYVKYDGWRLSGWSMSETDINALSSGMSSECSALFTNTSSETSGDVGSGISILFKYKNPEKKNSLAQLLSTFVGTTDDFGKIPADQIAERLPKFDEHRFVGWNPDPNEFNDGNFPKNRVAEVLAEFGKKESGANQWDLYIIPHKRLTSQNRPNKEERFDDGTVRAKSSDEKYKPSDMRM